LKKSEKRNNSLLLKSVGLFFAILTVLLIVIYLISTPEFGEFKDFIIQNPILAVLVYLIYRVLSALIPIIPTDGLTFLAIPIGGGIIAFSLDFLGGSIGAIIAYVFGRVAGNTFLHKFLGKNLTNKIESIKIKKGHDILIVTVLRIIYFGALSSPVCYWAGLRKIKFNHFLISHLISSLVLRLPIFIIGDLAIKNGISLIIVLGLIIYTTFAVFISKKYLYVKK